MNDQVRPFECIGSDGKVYLHYEKWERWRNGRLESHPPLWEGRARYDIELSYPSDTLAEVPIDRNPHDHNGLRVHAPSGRTCYYSCNDWLTIFDIAETNTPHGISLRTVVENGIDKPTGERIRLMSTSMFLENEPWSTNPSNHFAYFRGKYWRATMIIPLQAWEPRRYPHSNRASLHVLHPLAIPPELLRIEGDQLFQPPSMQGIKDTIPEDIEGHYARWESNSVVSLGIVGHLVWEHSSPETGTTRFLTVTPQQVGEALPAAFLNMPDGEEGIFVPMERKERKYLCSRIASGTDKGRGVHFRLLNVFGDPLP